MSLKRDVRNAVKGGVVEKRGREKGVTGVGEGAAGARGVDRSIQREQKAHHRNMLPPPKTEIEEHFDSNVTGADLSRAAELWKSSQDEGNINTRAPDRPAIPGRRKGSDPTFAKIEIG